MRISKGTLYALIGAFGLGSIATQAKLVFADGSNAMTLMFWRFVISVIIIGAMLLIQRQSFILEKPWRFSAFLLGFIWSGAMILFLKSVETISVSLAVLILYSYPILVLLVSMMLGKTRVSGFTIGVFLLAFAGIALMLEGGNISANTTGILFAILSACGAAYTFISGSHVASNINPVTLTFWIHATGLILVMFLIPDQYQMPDSLTGLVFLVSATLCYVVAILGQFQALAMIPAPKAAFIFNLEPFVSITLAVTILNERLSITQWAGAVIVLTVLFLFAGKIEGHSTNQASPPKP